MTDDKIISEAKSSLVILKTMISGICEGVGIDADETRMSVCADDEELMTMSITEALERAENSIKALNKVGF